VALSNVYVLVCFDMVLRWFVHLAIDPDTTVGPPEWLEPVTDELYNKLK